MVFPTRLNHTNQMVFDDIPDFDPHKRRATARALSRLLLTSMISACAMASLAQETPPPEITAPLANAADPQSLFNSGMVSLETGDLPRAIAQFERVLRLDPDANAVRVLLGSLYLQIDNPARAQMHLRDAQTMGGMPKDTEAEVAALLAEARRRQSPYSSRASLSFGVQSDTNATGGPDNSSAFSSGTAEDDVSVVASAEFSLGYDLGYQDGRALNLTAQLYAAEFGKSASPSSQYASLSAGYVLPVDDSSYVAPTLFASHGRLRGDPFRTQLGIGLNYVNTLSPTNRLSLGARLADETFSTRAGANNPDRDGTLMAINGRLDRFLDPVTRIYVMASGSQKDAAQAYQSFSSLEFGAGISRQFRFVRDQSAEIIITAGLDLTVGRARYDAPDQVNSTTDKRDDVHQAFNRASGADGSQLLGWDRNHCGLCLPGPGPLRQRYPDGSGAFIGYV